MAESTEDKNVDQVIGRMQALLDELKAAQAKDVKDESDEEYGEGEQPKSLSEARVRVREHFRTRRQGQQ